MKILRTARLRFSFIVSYKNSVPQEEEGNHYSAVKGVLYHSGGATCFFYFQSESPFL